MKNFGAILAAFGVTVTVWGAQPAFGDQNDPRLAPLFEGLMEAPRDSRNAASIEQEIWAIWVQPATASGRVLMRQGTLQMQNFDLMGAIDTFTALIEIEPEFAEAWNKRATIHYLVGNLAESLTDIEQVMALEPRHFGAQAGRGLVLDAMDLDEAALEEYERALEMNPHMASIRDRLEALRDELQGRDL